MIAQFEFNHSNNNNISIETNFSPLISKLSLPLNIKEAINTMLEVRNT